jgi:conserved oligomeric Golgi complex subunit 6
MSEKHVKGLTLSLAAATDDLAKNKAAVAAAQIEIASFKTQVEEANRAAEAAPINVDAQLKQQTVQAKQEAQNAREDLATFKQLLAESQVSFAADMEGTKATHKRELEDVVAKHVEHTGTLKASHGQELAQLSNERVKLRSALEDEREAKEKALAQIASLQQVRSPPPSPRNGNAAGVGKDEIEKLHRAHNATLMTMEAEHNSELRALKDELSRKQEGVDEVRAEKERKELEISFMAEEKRDAEDELQRCVSCSGVLHSGLTVASQTPGRDEGAESATGFSEVQCLIS